MDLHINPDNRKWLMQLSSVQRIASANRIMKLLNDPVRYLSAQLHRFLLYRYTGSMEVQVKTFWNERFSLKLPAALDIYLTGGKSHSSELRFTRFICKYLPMDAIVIDAGAHFGFYSLLFSRLAHNGKVYAFEPAPDSFALLQKNLHNTSNSIAINAALSDEAGMKKFYNYDMLHSEFNSLDDEQYLNQAWRRHHEPKKIEVLSLTLDKYCKKEQVLPSFIKIDVEGGEPGVVEGARLTISKTGCLIAMEFLCAERGNSHHMKADRLLRSLNYHSFVLNDHGDPERITDIPAYLESNQLESDNILYARD